MRHFTRKLEPIPNTPRPIAAAGANSHITTISPWLPLKIAPTLVLNQIPNYTNLPTAPSMPLQKPWKIINPSMLRYVVTKGHKYSPPYNKNPCVGGKGEAGRNYDLYTRVYLNEINVNIYLFFFRKQLVFCN